MKYGIFVEPLELWLVNRETEQPEQFDTEWQAQDAADALNENARSGMAPDADPEPYQVRRLPTDADLTP